jgi:hypothetical protein
MHFHLPKPLHGWRDFLGEVGIIVVGVLIALAAEQIVESIHWREQMRGTRNELYDEARGNLTAARWRQLQEPCISRRLDEIGRIFRHHADGGAISLGGPIAHPVYLSGTQSDWQIALSSQSLAHMALEEKTKFAGAFANYENFNHVLDREQESWLKLDMLDHPDLLSDGDWPILHQAYAEAVSLNARLTNITNYVLTSTSLGQKLPPLKPPPPFREGLRTICKPVLKS